MLLDSHKKYHDMGPADLGLKETLYVQVARTTTQTGEQFIFNVPFYQDDSREMFTNRINFCLSVMQDRMEDENKAVEEVQKRQLATTIAKGTIGRNHKAFVSQAKAVKKRFARGVIDEATADAEIAALKEKMVQANAEFQKQLDDAGEVMVLPSDFENVVDIKEA